MYALLIMPVCSQMIMKHINNIFSVRVEGCGDILSQRRAWVKHVRSHTGILLWVGHMSIYVYMYSDNWCADLELLFSASPYNKGHGNVLKCFDKNIIRFGNYYLH